MSVTETISTQLHYMPNPIGKYEHMGRCHIFNGLELVLYWLKNIVKSIKGVLIFYIYKLSKVQKCSTEIGTDTE